MMHGGNTVLPIMRQNIGVTSAYYPLSEATFPAGNTFTNDTFLTIPSASNMSLGSPGINGQTSLIGNPYAVALSTAGTPKAIDKFTIAVWMRQITSTITNSPAVGLQRSGALQTYCGMGTIADGNDRVWVTLDFLGGTYYDFSLGAHTAAWKHIAVVYNGPLGTLKLYHAGALVRTVTGVPYAEFLVDQVRLGTGMLIPGNDVNWQQLHVSCVAESDAQILAWAS